MPKVDILSSSENIKIPDIFFEQNANLASPFKEIPKGMWLGQSPNWL